MKVLIIGSTAVIGKALVQRLSLFCSVKLAGRRDADIVFDLTDWRDQPDPNEFFDVVVHVAADFGGQTDKDFIRAEMTNTVGTLSACSLAHQVQAKHFILFSSIFSTYQIGDPYFGIYAITKRHSEEVAQFYCAERGIALTILRPSQVYDEGECRRHQKLLYTMADQAQERGDITIYGAHDARRNYIHLSDIVEICARVIQSRIDGIYTCAHPKSVRVSEMADAAFSAFGYQGKLKFMPEKADLVDLPEIADNALYEKIRYSPSVSIKEGFLRIRNKRSQKL